MNTTQGICLINNQINRLHEKMIFIVQICFLFYLEAGVVYNSQRGMNKILSLFPSRYLSAV